MTVQELINQLYQCDPKGQVKASLMYVGLSEDEHVEVAITGIASSNADLCLLDCDDFES